MSSSHIPDYKSSYNQHIKNLLNAYERDQAMSLAVGGEFEAFGLLEFYLLLDCKLEKQHSVIDIGCGSGRLAVQLAPFLEGQYTGIDVVPELVDYAKEISRREDWHFAIAQGLTIPEPDNSADFVCFFSVLTHLLHEESYQYLEEAKRVLKPGGRIVFSFLEFAIPSHWALFSSTIKDTNPNKVLTQFLSRDAIEVWAKHLELNIATIYDGDKPHIPLPQPVKLDNGTEITELGCFGQSICILVNQ
ncbi:MAG: class I SAM-dependent methyltransferase [Candidatus Parabeggiatoa sp.]|nr:class I SAM-dependent methyltransferase [Candidatus Parabeggiatoa sp.]